MVAKEGFKKIIQFRKKGNLFHEIPSNSDVLIHTDPMGSMTQFEVDVSNLPKHLEHISAWFASDYGQLYIFLHMVQIWPLGKKL